MRVYAESNFVLEIVLEQEQHPACEELVSLAASHSIELVLPAYALLEPHDTIVRRAKGSQQLRADLDKRRRELQRTAMKAGDALQLRRVSDLLLRSEQEASRRFIAVRERLLAASHLVAIDASTLGEATRLVDGLGLELLDAVMLAAVLADAASRPSPSVFLNRNTKDFDDPAIAARLRALGCELIGSFAGGLARAKNALAVAPAGGP